MATKRRGPEKEIEMEILGFLRSIGVFCWKNDRVGTWDPTKKTFRKNHNPYKIRGVSDILGMIFGKFFAVEVKSKTGVVSKEQRVFLVNVNENKGIGIVARSLEGFIEEFSKHFPDEPEFQRIIKQYVRNNNESH